MVKGNAKRNFYIAKFSVGLALLVTAVIQTSHYNGRKSLKSVEAFETLSAAECIERFEAIQREFSVPVINVQEGYAVMGRAYALIDSVHKLMEHPPDIASTYYDFPTVDRVRDIPVKLPQMIDDYSMRELRKYGGTPEQVAAYQWFEDSHLDPLTRPAVHVPGFWRVIFFWILFHGVVALFFPFHYGIKIREAGMKLHLEFLGNPKLVLWTIFWEIGMFRYPRQVSIAEQLYRARLWAALVLGSAISCFAGTGKVCERRQRAPQHQQDDRSLALTFTTFIASNYLVLNGAEIFPAPVLESTATAALPCGVYAGIFNAEPIGERSRRPIYGREDDITLGWTRTFGKYAFTADATYVDVFPITKWPSGDVWQFNERMTRSIPFGKRHALSPYLWFRQLKPARGPTPVGGNFIHVGATLSRAVNDHVSASVTAEVERDPGALGFHKGYIGRTFGGLNWKLGNGVTMQFPQLLFTDPLSRVQDGRRPTFSFGIGWIFSPAH